MKSAVIFSLFVGITVFIGAAVFFIERDSDHLECKCMVAQNLAEQND